MEYRFYLAFCEIWVGKKMIYKLISNLINKQFNMRFKNKHQKFTFWFSFGVILSGLIYALLTPYPVLATVVDWNDTVYELDVDSVIRFIGTPIGHLKAQYFNNTWFVGYSYFTTSSPNNRYFMGKFDDDLNRLDGFDNLCINDFCQIPRGNDFQISNSSHLIYRYWDFEVASNIYRERYISQQDLSLSSERDLGGVQSEREYFRVLTDWNFYKIQDKFISIYGEDNTYYYYDTSQHSLLIPDGITVLKNPYLFYNSKWNSYNLFFDDGDKIRVIYYDSGLNYLALQTLVDITNDVNQTSVMWLDNALYLIGKYNETEIYQSIWYSETQTHYSRVEEETFTIPNTNSTYEVHLPYLAYDSGEEKKYLFYSLLNNTGQYNDHIYYLEEQIECNCYDWYNTSECIGTDRVRTRDCIPSDCDDEISFVWDDFCNETQSLIDRHEYIRRERFCESQPCNSEWYNPLETATASCSAYLVVDGDCSNIVSNATLTTNVIYESSIHGRDQKYHLLVCNPLYNCFEEDPLCHSQWNRTQTVNWINYYPNDTIDAHFELSNVQGCQGKFLWGTYGWKEYRVTGQLSYCCDRICGGYKCVRRGLVDYRIQQYPDCSLNESSKVVCSKGCVRGECSSELAEEELVRSPSGNPFEWIVGEASFLFPTFMLNLFAVGVSAYGGIYASSMTKKMELGLAVMMGLVLIFLSMGWLPQIIGILWILGIGLLLVNMIRKGVKE